MEKFRVKGKDTGFVSKVGVGLWAGTLILTRTQPGHTRKNAKRVSYHAGSITEDRITLRYRFHA